jgi:hypothetical protein
VGHYAKRRAFSRKLWIHGNQYVEISKQEPPFSTNHFCIEHDVPISVVFDSDHDVVVSVYFVEHPGNSREFRRIHENIGSNCKTPFHRNGDQCNAGIQHVEFGVFRGNVGVVCVSNVFQLQLLCEILFENAGIEQ